MLPATPALSTTPTLAAGEEGTLPLKDKAEGLNPTPVIACVPDAVVISLVKFPHLIFSVPPLAAHPPASSIAKRNRPG